MMSVVLTLYSCTNEDFYSSSENHSKQEIISKSLWKEDTLFTKRIYDHFRKSFLSTEADQKKFVSEHGTPVWEYTMTMGFRRNQLFVPLIKNNQVTGMMRVQRQDKKAFYDFTQNSEALRFFDLVMYNRNLDKLQPQKDEKLNESISAKGGGATWTCTKRIVITGYHMEGDVMVMETSAMDVCKYSYTGVKPYVDHLDVYTDGMEGGGGGEEEDGEEYLGSACEKLNNQKNDVVYKSKVTYLKGKTNDTFESGFRVGNPTPESGQIGTQYQQLSNAAGSSTIDFKYFNTTYGMMHSHHSALVPMFSPDDVNTFIKLLINAHNNGIPQEDVFLTLVNPDGTIYQLRGGGIDVASLSIYSSLAIDILNKTYISKDYNLNKANQSSEFYQKNFLKFMKDNMNVTGAKLYSIDSNGDSKEVYLQNGAAVAIECPK